MRGKKAGMDMQRGGRRGGGGREGGETEGVTGRRQCGGLRHLANLRSVAMSNGPGLYNRRPSFSSLPPPPSPSPPATLLRVLRPTSLPPTLPVLPVTVPTSSPLSFRCIFLLSASPTRWSRPASSRLYFNCVG